MSSFWHQTGEDSQEEIRPEGAIVPHIFQEALVPSKRLIDPEIVILDLCAVSDCPLGPSIYISGLARFKHDRIKRQILEKVNSIEANDIYLGFTGMTG